MSLMLRSSDNFDVVLLPKVDSTNEEIKRRIANGTAKEGLVVVAEEQMAGKGRKGRAWVSEKGNLYVSILLRPECPASDAAQMSFVSACAMRDALIGLADVTFKWPNDILLQNRKVGGILLESATKKNGMLDWMVIGLGLNINNYPQNTDFKAISIKDALNRPLDKQVILPRLLEQISAWYLLWLTHGFKPVREYWLKHAHLENSPLNVKLDKKEISGTFKSIDAQGALLLQTESGMMAIDNGDVFFN